MQHPLREYLRTQPEKKLGHILLDIIGGVSFYGLLIKRNKGQSLYFSRYPRMRRVD